MNNGRVFIGHLTTDDIYYEESGLRYENNIGGACAYSAFGSALWDSNVSMISRAGQQYNLSLLSSYCEMKNIHMNHVEKILEPGIDITIHYLSDGTRCFIPKLHSSNYYVSAPLSKNIPEELIKRERFFHITPIPLKLQIEIAEKIGSVDRKKTISIDPDIIDITKNNMPLWKQLFKSIDYFLVSEVEFETFLNCNGIEVSTEQIFERMIKLSKLLNVKNMILKCGAQGVYAIDELKNCFYVMPYPISVVDCTGAGDSFAGGFGFGIVDTGNLKEALIYGVVTSSFAIEDVGLSGLVNADKVKAITRYYEMKGKIHEKENLYNHKIV